MCGIYCIENLINGKKYIGQSIDIEERIKHHKTLLNSEVTVHTNAHLQNAWNKYGSENFKFYVLEECDKNELDDKEKYWSEFYDVYDMEKGYALKTAGQGFGNRIISEEVRQKISEANRGENNYWYGKKIPDDIRQKMKENHYDCSGVNSPHCRPVLQYNFDGELLSEYDYIREAGYKTNTNEESIRKCCNKEMLSAGGFIWRFHTDPLVDYNRQEYFKPKNTKKTIQYSTNGMILCIYDGVSEASRITHINYSGISNACNKRAKTAGGFIWRYEDDKLTEEEIKILHDNPIIVQDKTTKVDQYSKDGRFLMTWWSMAQVEREIGVRESHISQCLSVDRKTAGGFVWKRHIDNTKLI